MNPFRRKPAPPPDAATAPTLEDVLARVHGMVKTAEERVDALKARLEAELAARELKGDER